MQVKNLRLQFNQGSHASWKVLESPEFFFLKIPGPGKSWKNIFESRAFF